MAAEEAALRRLAARERRREASTVGSPRARRSSPSASARRAEPLAPGSLGDLVVRRDGAVVHVVVGGRVVVENGGLATGDVERIAAQAREEAARLWKRL